MAAAAPLISDPLVRNLGTIGGSLCHADPAGDWGSVMLALRCVAWSSGARAASGRCAIPEFLVDTFTTALEPDEILTEVRVPQPAARSGGAYLKLERKVGDFATVAAAVHLSLSNGTIERAGIGLTAVGPKNLQADGRRGEPRRRRAHRGGVRRGRTARGRGVVARSSDLRGSAEYKRHVVEVYVRRGLARALEMARAA